VRLGWGKCEQRGSEGKGERIGEGKWKGRMGGKADPSLVEMLPQEDVDED
jgi:hypothetical protein